MLTFTPGVNLESTIHLFPQMHVFRLWEEATQTWGDHATPPPQGDLLAAAHVILVITGIGTE